MLARRMLVGLSARVPGRLRARVAKHRELPKHCSLWIAARPESLCLLAIVVLLGRSMCRCQNGEVSVHHIFSVAIHASCVYGRCVCSSSSSKPGNGSHLSELIINSSRDSSAVILDKEGISILFWEFFLIFALTQADSSTLHHLPLFSSEADTALRQFFPPSLLSFIRHSCLPRTSLG